MVRTAEVVIVGGGVMGSAIAWHLREHGLEGRIVVVERDPTYARASSALAMGGIRQQFDSAVDIALMHHSVAFWRGFDERMSTPAHRARAWFRQRGYLFLVDAPNAARFEARMARQQRLGARVERLDPEAIARMVPGIRTDDLVCGVLGPEDGYADPREVLAGWRAGAVARGVEYLADELTGIARDGGRVRAVSLAREGTLGCGVLVCAAGAWSADVGRMAGLELPIVPQRQHLFRCALPAPWPARFPMVIDPSGVHWRHEDPDHRSARDRIVVARTRTSEPPGERFDCDDGRWAADFRPPLVARMPAFERLELVEGWAGLYEMTPDQHPLLGPHPALAGFLVAAGFSGHGLMMSPAVGQVVSEFVRTGRAETIDVTALAPDRFERGAPVPADAMI